ncbi:MAG: methylenetetrahydrofolate reductase [NAD(P)H] [Pirellulales bacterium]|nr:methylenetetrahydrofolate reductase [NAD(P)H] [Pirellulales bacterium]
MKFSTLYRSGKFGLSFELFPPKTAVGDMALIRHVKELMKFGPDIITCTYAAGGSTRGKTLDVATRVHATHHVSVASHLTCLASSVDQLREYLDEAAQRGIENIVALRGDPPQNESRFVPTKGGLCHANELVTLIRTEFPHFGIAVAGYPEKHREAPSMEVDLANLKRKVDAGADAILSQLFYDNEDFFRFRDRCGTLGIEVPIVPGLLPVTKFQQVQRITSLCGAKMPGDFLQALQAQQDHPQAQAEIGIEYAIQQTQNLIHAGVPGIHFYVLNMSQAATQVLQSVSRPG